LPIGRVPLKIPLAAHVATKLSQSQSTRDFYKRPSSVLRALKSNGKHVAKCYLLCKSLIFQAVYRDATDKTTLAIFPFHFLDFQGKLLVLCIAEKNIFL